MAGCKGQSDEVDRHAQAVAESKVAVAPAPKLATYQEWQDALQGLGAFRTSATKENDDGVREYDICLSGQFDDQGKCPSDISMRVDGFNKGRLFKDINGLADNIRATYVQHKSYKQGAPTMEVGISLPNCGQPNLFFTAKYSAKSWLFLEQVAIMVDGAVIFERKLDFDRVQRATSYSGIEEEASFSLTPSEIEALRRINVQSDLAVRFTGKSSYVTMLKGHKDALKNSLVKMLVVNDTMDGLLKKVGPVKDAAC